MAIIQSIRERAGVLVSIIIGMALFAFILTDFLNSGSSILRKQRSYVVVVNGDGVDYDHYQQKISDLEELTKAQKGVTSLNDQEMDQVRNTVWDEVTQQMVMDREYKKLGLTVTSDELYDLVGGQHPHPYIRQFFGDPKTGMIDQVRLHQFLQHLNQVGSNDEYKKLYLYIEDLIYSDRKITKYRTLIRKGLYATSAEVKRKALEFTKSVDFSYLLKRYTDISDSSVNVSSDDIEAYYKLHKEDYKQKASRDIRYVVWNIVPSKKDFKDAKSWIDDVYKEFKTVDVSDAWQYIKANSDDEPTENNFARGELPAKIDSFAFNSNIGDIYGPYFENNSYKIARLIKVVYLPDSVRASHILLRATNDNIRQVKLVADSLLDIIKKGGSFEEIARKNSDDGNTSEKGGDLGWFKEGKMLQAISDTCFEGKIGDVKLVISQYGIHIVKIVDQSKPVKKVEVGILTRQVRPSEATDQYYYGLASTFGGKNNTLEKFNKAVNADKSLNLRSATGIRPTDETVNGAQRSRELIRWAFDAEEGEVTPKVYQFEGSYVVAVLDKMREEGYAPVEDVKNIIKVNVSKEKKAEKLMAQMNEVKSSTSSLDEIASKLGVEVKSANNIRFSSYSIPNLGAEPKIEAAATTIDQDAVVGPIDGDNGVFIIKTDKINMPDDSQLNNFNRSFIERAYASKVYMGSKQALDDLAGIKDNRINFY